MIEFVKEEKLKLKKPKNFNPTDLPDNEYSIIAYRNPYINVEKMLQLICNTGYNVMDGIYICDYIIWNKGAVIKNVKTKKKALSITEMLEKGGLMSNYIKG